MNKFLSISCLLFVTCIVHNNLLVGMTQEHPGGRPGEHSKPLTVTGTIEPKHLDLAPWQVQVKLEQAYQAIIAGDLTALQTALMKVPREKIVGTFVQDVDQKGKAGRCFLALFYIFSCLKDIISCNIYNCIKCKRCHFKKMNLLDKAVECRLTRKNPDRLALVKYLLDSKFDLSEINNFHYGKKVYRGTLLHAAILYDDIDLVSLLLQYNADRNIYSGEGHTPLMLAAFKDQRALCKRLLDAGADPLLPAKYGVTNQYAYNFAQSEDVKRLLIDAYNA